MGSVVHLSKGISIPTKIAKSKFTDPVVKEAEDEW
jgi:hypothetical protein